MLNLPKGFKTYALEAGVKYANRKDVGIIYSEIPAVYAGIFTSNKVFAAPVKLCRERLGQKIQSVVVNSGNANACTGQQGYKDALAICTQAEKQFNLQKSKALSLSTGVIGIPLPVEKILNALQNIEKAVTGAEAFSQAIMTTDTFPKCISKTVEINNKKVTLIGFSKGAGMIAPNMATMLGFILTDAKIGQKKLQKMVAENAGDTFNAITIDGDMSTNDSLIVLANGQSEAVIKGKEEKQLFKKALFEIMEGLAKLIVKDGEGATKLIEVSVENAKTPKDAKKIGNAICNSLLVKTAFFGNDPNWGRILAAAGYSGAKVHEEKTELYYMGQLIFSKGKPIEYDKPKLVEKLKDSKEIPVRIILNEGKASKRFFTCDLSYDYVKVNAEYTT